MKFDQIRFKKLGAMAVGIDFNPGYRNPHVVFGDAMDIMYPKDGFDFLYINVMDHIADWPKFLDEVQRVLAPGGYFFNDLDQNEMDAFAVHNSVKERPQLEALMGAAFRKVSQRKVFDEKDPGDMLLSCKECMNLLQKGGIVGNHLALRSSLALSCT